MEEFNKKDLKVADKVADEILIRKVIKEYCILENYEVVEAENGIDALEKIKHDNIVCWQISFFACRCVWACAMEAGKCANVCWHFLFFFIFRALAKQNFLL